MKMILIGLIGLSLALGLTVTKAAPFQNLNFEAPNLPAVPIGQGFLTPVGQAFPGWTAFVGTTPVDPVPYNLLPFGSAATVLLRPTETYIEGFYHALLIPGYDERTAAFAGVSLAQAGLVPADAQSILFYAAPLASLSTFDISVTFGGEEIALVPLEQSNGITLFGGDVSAFAGTTTELRFTIDYGNSAAHIDAISFSPLPVPEPSTWTLLGIGLLCFARYIRKRSRC